MDASGKRTKILPANAYTELKPGEKYVPVVPADKLTAEITPRSVLMGVIGAVIFTFAASYIGLKTGNVIETAIPIAILAIFFGRLLAPRNTLLQNVIVQSIGAASGVVVAGAVFTIPALYIIPQLYPEIQLQPSILQIFIACTVGGFLGIVLIIPLRRYFVRTEHGKLPFPEATATTEILVSGETATGTGGGKMLLTSFGIGMVFDFIVEIFHVWNPTLTARALLGGWGEKLYSGARIDIRATGLATYLGLGYIIGVRYAAIIAAGSVLASMLMVPLVYYVGSRLSVPVPPADILIHDMSPAEIFGNYVRPIGIGGIAMAGLLGVIKMSKIIIGSLSLGFKGLTESAHAGSEKHERTDLDILPRNVLLIQIAVLILMFLAFFWVSGSLKIALVGVAVTAVLGFLFTPVAARAIAIVGVNPVSGMTLITLIIACAILAAIRGPGEDVAVYMFTALIVGCAICTALSTSGAFISDLKIGYWLGSTPRKQEVWKFLGVVVAALCVGVAIWLLESGYGFIKNGQPNPDLMAPQGNLMAAVVYSSLDPNAITPWLLYGLGACMVILLEMVKVPALAFSLGVYLPMSINLPILFGGIAGWFIQRRAKDDRRKTARRDQTILVASGLMAGAAIAGILSATFKVLDNTYWSHAFDRLVNISQYPRVMAVDGSLQAAPWFGSRGVWFGALAFIALIVTCHLLAKRGADEQIRAEDQALEEHPEMK
ncbi:MAG: oligopeptide transporter, OPT family [Candidatus Eisenbacteria sp.]|nr:oligopeptide transporter, OPT family [Candidatus Eisenbacteria bacterium]